jgi:hypothetical protein
MDHRAAARGHIESFEARIASQQRVVEESDAAGRDAAEARQRLQLMKDALSAMQSELAKLLPTDMDVSRPNYPDPNDRRWRRKTSGPV